MSGFDGGTREIIAGSALFRGLDAALIDRALGLGSEVELEAGGVHALSRGERTLGIIVAGTAEIHRPAGDGSVLMSVLRPGSVTGAATLFGDGGEVLTELRAPRGCRAVCWSEDGVRVLMRADFAFTERYLEYLTGRIRFLVQRIESIACPTAAAKLYNHLLKLSEDGAVRLPKGMSGLASAIGVSRATVYRAADELERDGLIRHDGKTIYIM